MINDILTELERLAAEVQTKIDAEAVSGPGGNMYEYMSLRGQKDGLLDAIHAVKMVDLQSILNAHNNAMRAALEN